MTGTKPLQVHTLPGAVLEISPLTSPDTVTRKMEAWCKDLGGPFGTLLICSHDFLDDPAPWEHSMDLLANEVMPHLSQPAE